MPRTKDALEVLGSLGLRTAGERDERILIVVDPIDENTWKSFRNLGERVQLVTPNELNTYDILVNDWLVFSKATLERRGHALRTSKPSDSGGAEPGTRSPSERTTRRHPMPSKHPRDIIIRPVVSEKSYAAFDENIYTFVVANDANKIEIRHAIETIFGVRVTNVNTLNRAGKRKRNRRSGGYGTRPATKRAVVSLAEGDRIEIFGS